MKAADRWLQRWRVARAARHIPGGARVLDVGCEDGALFRILGDAIGPSVGIDPALPGEARLGPHHLIPGRFPDRIPVPGPFDAITLLAVLEHIPAGQEQRVAGACAGLLKPGGLVILTVPSPKVDAILDALRLFRVVDADTLEEHHGFDPARTPALFEGGGFEGIGTERFQLGLNNLFVFRRI